MAGSHYDNCPACIFRNCDSFGLETGENVCWKERPQRDVLLDLKQNCKCCGPPSGPLLFVGPVDFFVDSNSPIHIGIDPVLLVQYVDSH